MKRDHRITIRLTKLEHLAVLLAAKLQNAKPSGYIRNLIISNMPVKINLAQDITNSPVKVEEDYNESS